MHLVHSWLSQKLSNCILISYMRMSWFLHSLVNTWCCQIFLLILAIPIKRWSDVFWISLLTSDVKTSFYVVLGHPVSSCVVCVSVCVCARAHADMTVEARGQHCVSSSMILHLRFWDSVSHWPGAHWPSRSSWQDNMFQQSPSLCLLRSRITGSCHCALRFKDYWGSDLRSPCL